jgi:hypothetical protein
LTENTDNIENKQDNNDKVFQSTVSFVEARRVRGFIRAKSLEDARTQLVAAATNEGLLSFNIDDIQEIVIPKEAFGEVMDIPMEDSIPTEVKKPTLN